MVEINKQILEKYGIYETRKLKENEETKLLKIKKELEKVTNVFIERLYLIDKCAWGIDAENEEYSICILMDKRVKDLESCRRNLERYCQEKKITILFWSLCQFEKRKNAPTEKDYYIHRYGIKVYDSGKETDINENVKETQYAAQNAIYKSIARYTSGNPDYAMHNLVRIYTLKIGYAAIEDGDLETDLEFAKLVSSDNKAIELIDKLLKQTDKEEKIKVKREFEKYLKSVKQVRFPMKLNENPTMDIYGKLLKKKNKYGKLDIKDLKKEDLYIMYILQNIQTSQIADLYNVDDEKITNKRKAWNIKLREKGVIEKTSIIENTIKQAENINYRYAYVFLKKMGIMNFENYTFDILEYMQDSNVYLLKEFWQFTKTIENDFLGILINNNQDNYYYVSLCIDLFIQNNLIEEVDFKQYKITKKGKELIQYCYNNDIDKITIPVIYKCFDKVNFYSLNYFKGFPSEFEEITWNKLYASWSKCCKENFPELLVKENLPLDYVLMENEINSSEEIALVWMYLYFKSLNWKNEYPKQWEKAILIGYNDIMNPIQEQINKIGIKIIPKTEMTFNNFLDISALCRYIKIENLDDIIMFTATSCAYLIKNMER